MQNALKMHPFTELFHATVTLNGLLQLRAMLDTGSMACTVSEEWSKIF